VKDNTAIIKPAYLICEDEKNSKYIHVAIEIKNSTSKTLLPIIHNDASP
jgi:hypothetical protein